MKLILLIAFYLITAFNSIYCNSMICIQQDMPLDQISIEEVIISGIHLNQDVKDYSVFGKIDSVVFSEDEIRNIKTKKVYLGNSYLEFSKSKLTGFQINDKSIILNDSIMIGINISELEKLFPNSFNKMYESEDHLILKVQLDTSDSYLLFKCRDNIVEQISIWEDL